MMRVILLVFTLAGVVASGVVIDWFARTTATTRVASIARTYDGLGGGQAIVPIEPAVGLNPLKVALGQRLFHEPRLSHDDSISCASCHILDRGGADGRRFSPGIGDAIGVINTPTVFNTALNFRQFWDGRALTLEKQAVDPIESPIEMGSSLPEVAAKLALDTTYVDAFREIYPAGITPESIVDALATFERSLTTTNSRFDRFLRGDLQAISVEEKAGYALFISLGCISCHQGANVGGNVYQRFGIMGDYFADRGGMTTADLGRYNITGQEEDRHVFKVPGLRTVALTPPYFHDGSTMTLTGAVKVMAKYQLGTELTSEQVDLIVQFLTSLSNTTSLESAP